MLRFVEVEVRVRGGVGLRFVRVWVSAGDGLWNGTLLT